MKKVELIKIIKECIEELNEDKNNINVFKSWIKEIFANIKKNDPNYDRKKNQKDPNGSMKTVINSNIDRIIRSIKYYPAKNRVELSSSYSKYYPKNIKKEFASKMDLYSSLPKSGNGWESLSNSERFKLISSVTGEK